MNQNDQKIYLLVLKYQFDCLECKVLKVGINIIFFCLQKRKKIILHLGVWGKKFIAKALSVIIESCTVAQNDQIQCP